MNYHPKNLVFLKFLKSTNFFIKFSFLLLFNNNVNKEKMSQLKRARSVLKAIKKEYVTEKHSFFVLMMFHSHIVTQGWENPKYLILEIFFKSVILQF